MKRSVSLVGVFAGLLSLGAADVVTISERTPALYLPGNKTGALQAIAVETRKQSVTDYPASVAAPIFWFDASDRAGWTVDADGNVQRIPNKIDNGRYLTATETSDQWKTSSGCGAKQFGTHNVPKLLESDATLGGRPSVDFGPLASKRLLFFNPIGPEGNTTNLLENIGSIVAVWNSENGGGYLLGDNLNGGYMWCRGPDPTLPSGSGVRTLTYMAPMSQYNTYSSIKGGYFRLDGRLQACSSGGFNGTWGIVSLLPTAANLTASGLGMNDTRVTAFSGGFRVAEMLIFDRVLTTAECELLETWLKDKWLARADRGVNGNAALSVLRPYQTAGTQWGFATSLAVPTDETLTLGRLEGGYGDLGESPDANDGGAALVKSGAGTLVLGEASSFSAPIRLNDGTLRVNRKPIPTELPFGAYLDFDASVAASLETTSSDDVEYLDFWQEQLKPQVAGKDFIGAKTMASGTDRPRVLRNALGPGLNILDFGKRQTSSPTRYLEFCVTNLTDAAHARQKQSTLGPATYFAVIGAQDGGGDILGADSGWAVSRGVASVDWQTQLCGLYGTIAGESITNHVTCMIDGVLNSPASGYPTPGYHVVAIRGPAASTMDRIGSYNIYAGGLRLGEVVAYLRALSDEEMADASAYLMKKWLDRDAPGYARAATRAAADMQQLAVKNDVAVDVSAGTVVVDSLAGANGTLVKEGAGTLAVRNLDLSNVKLVVKDGSVAPAPVTDVASDCELASGASFHLDATQTATFDFETEGGDRRILYWRDVSNRANVAFAPSFARAPTLTTATDGLKAELPVVDFGNFTLSQGTGRDLHFARPIESLKSVFVVWATQPTDSRGIVLGSSRRYPGGTSNNHYGYLRPSASDTADVLLHDNNTYAQIYEGTFLTNGVAVKPVRTAPPLGRFFLMESHPQGAAHISALGVSDVHASNRNGGVRIAELVVYERTLSEREKIATRNYLMQKWFGYKTGAEMPAPPAAQPIVLPELAVDGAAALPVDGRVSVLNLVGEGALTKSGSGTLALQDPAGFAGDVEVASGTLKLIGQTPESAGALVTDGLVFQADAGWGVSTVTNETTGIISVTNWASRVGGGWSAVPFKQTVLPRYEGANDLGGHRVVTMPMGDANGMIFAKNGVATNLFDGIASIFWVVGSHEGGGYLLGGGTNYESSANCFNFMRDRDGHAEGYFKSTDHILNGVQYWTVPPNLRKADWYADGRAIEPTTTSLSGAWDLLTCQINDTAHPFTCADGFAFDGRYIRNGGMGSNWCGGQKLAEVLFYDRRLTDEERVDVERYLRAKWGFDGCQSSPTNAVTVSIASGAELDLDGKSEYLQSVVGAGQVSNGTLRQETLVVDPTAVLAYDDVTLRLDAGQKVLVRNATIGLDTIIPIAEVALDPSVTKAVLKSAVFSYENCAGRLDYGRLFYEDGVLKARFEPSGMLIIVR